LNGDYATVVKVSKIPGSRKRESQQRPSAKYLINEKRLQRKSGAKVLDAQVCTKKIMIFKRKANHLLLGLIKGSTSFLRRIGGGGRTPLARFCLTEGGGGRWGNAWPPGSCEELAEGLCTMGWNAGPSRDGFTRSVVG